MGLLAPALDFIATLIHHYRPSPTHCHPKSVIVNEGTLGTSTTKQEAHEPHPEGRQHLTWLRADGQQGVQMLVCTTHVHFCSSSLVIFSALIRKLVLSAETFETLWKKTHTEPPFTSPHTVFLVSLP